MEGLNIWAVLVAGIAGFGLGAIWYSPVLFIKVWMKETGLTEEKAKTANTGLIMGLAFLLTLFAAFNLAMFFGGKVDLQGGILYGFLTGIGFVLPCLGILTLFEMTSGKLFAINAGYFTVMFTIMGAILGAWH
ncbi:MAG: DUF1761 domain-containing protein [Bacteroidetes bacterium]|nr:DUF1761 domain-containing protein [Bacteroidota bacterium]